MLSELEVQLLSALSEIEQRRVDAFLRLSRLERSLRSYIESELRQIHGRNWMRALPKDIKEKIDGRDLSYSDFPDLRKILSTHWRQLGVDGKYKKDHVLNHLEGLEPIRNDIAHSRNISSGALSMVDAAYFVVGTLTSIAPSEASLPATSHPTVALARIKSAIEHDGEIGQVDIDTLQRHEDPEIVEVVERFRRVKSRPGRPVALMADTRNEALQVLRQAIANPQSA